MKHLYTIKPGQFKPAGLNQNSGLPTFFVDKFNNEKSQNIRFLFQKQSVYHYGE